MIVFDSRSARALAAVLLLMAPAARGSDEREPIKSRYEADAACPAESRFIEEILARTPRARLAAEGESASIFEARILRRGKRFVGTLKIHRPEGSSEAREISATTCDSVVSALALFAALAIDPSASSSAEAPSVRPPESEVVANEEQPPPSPPPPTPQMPSPTTSQPVLHPEFSNVTRNSWTWNAGLQVLAMSAAAPGGVYGASLIASADRQAAPGGGLRIRLSAGYAQSLQVEAGQGVAQVLLPNAAVAVCPLRLRVSSQWVIRACGGPRSGIYFAQGSRLAVPDQTTRFWLDLEAIGSLEWRVGRMWALEAGVGPVIPLTRYTLVFNQPETLIYTPSTFGLWGGLGLTWGE